jgi:thiol-disulfide isomerase/thioredoxin
MMWTGLLVLGGVVPVWAGAAPDFRAVSLAGDTLQLGAFRGQVVLVDFWASWCPPCREQLQRLAALEKQVHGVVVLAVNVDSRRDKVDAYAKRVGLPRRVVLDPQGTIAARYAVQGMPWTVIVDPRGNVASARGGWGEADVAKLTAEVRRLAASGTAKQTSASFAPK